MSHGFVDVEAGQLPSTEQTLVPLPAHSFTIFFKIQCEVHDSPEVFIGLHIFNGLSLNEWLQVCKHAF